MPFDGSGFKWPVDPPPRRKVPPGQERVFLTLAALFAIGLFVLPVSAGTLVDVVRYFTAP